MRRNRKTVWKIWGEDIGIISGSAMHALASKALDSLKIPDKSKLIHIRGLINKTCIAVIEGQYLDISFETKKEIKLDDYLDMIDKKTGALIKTSVILGAMLESPNNKTSKIFSEIGRNFGHMFQIKDDVLGIWGNQEFGKPIGSDIIKKKKSFPILKLIQTSDQSDKKKTYEIFSKNINGKDKDVILELMNKYKIETYCNSILNEKYNILISLIDELEIKAKYKKMLLEINSFLMLRTK